MTEENQQRIQRLLGSMEQDLKTVRQLIGGEAENFLNTSSGFFQATNHSHDDGGIEGIFDGERMVDENGKSYPVPPNYASKSKLIEGDPLKLYTTPDGKYVYKQLGPVERRMIEGILQLDGTHYSVLGDDGFVYSILTACVTYYMALFGLKPGDRVVIMVPAEGQARWAVIENVLG